MKSHKHQPSSIRDAIAGRLECAGIMITAQRLDIAVVMLSHAQHLSAEQLLKLVNQNGGNVSKATVYNTLGLFARKGVVREVLVDPNRVFYDSNIDPHHHRYNEDSGELTDIYADCLRKDALPALPEGTELVDIDIIFRVKSPVG